MTTSKKLLLGFGTLAALLILSIAAIVFRCEPSRRMWTC